MQHLRLLDIVLHPTVVELTSRPGRQGLHPSFGKTSLSVMVSICTLSSFMQENIASHPNSKT